MEAHLFADRPWPRLRISSKLLAAFGALWLVALATGFFALAREEFTPVAASASQSQFPAGTTLTLAPDAPTLILFAHPYCPCTRATLRELDQLLADPRAKPATTVVFTLPRGIAPGWEQGSLWRSAAAMRGVRVVADPEGAEAGRFGVKGSGHVLLYEPSGKLVFSGGITSSRGHEGDNAGQAAVASALLGHAPAVARTRTFGCPLL